MVVGFVVREVWGCGVQYLSCLMRVSRSLVTLLFAFCFLLASDASFGFAELAIELLLVGSAFFGCVAFLIVSVVSFYASALCALVPFPKPTAGIDHHGSCVRGSSSLVRLSHVPESLPSEFVSLNLTKPLGELRILVGLGERTKAHKALA